MPHVPGKTSLVTMCCFFFLLDKIHVGLAETDPPELDAIFTCTSEALFENNFTGLEKKSVSFSVRCSVEL